MTQLFVKDAMAVGVEGLSPEDTIDSANQLIMKGKYRSVPIISPVSKVVGIVTLNDLKGVPSEKAKITKLREVMTQNVITCETTDTLYEALRKMTTNQVERLPVVEVGSGKLVGLLTSSDLFRAYERAVTSIQNK